MSVFFVILTWLASSARSETVISFRAQPAPTSVPEMERALVEALNTARTSRSVGAVEWSEALAGAARDQARHMEENLDVTGETKRLMDLGERIAAHGYQAARASEQPVFGTQDAKEEVRQLLNTTFRATMLSPGFVHGAAGAHQTSSGRIIYVLIVAAPGDEAQKFTLTSQPTHRLEGGAEESLNGPYGRPPGVR